MSTPVSLETIYFDPEEANQLYAEWQTIVEERGVVEWTKLAVTKLFQRPLPERIIHTRPKHPPTEGLHKSWNPQTRTQHHDLVEEYLGLTSDPTYYSGLKPVDIKTDQAMGVHRLKHYVSARNISNLYLGVYHHVGEREASALLDTVLALDHLSPTNLLTQISRLAHTGWEPLHDRNVDDGMTIEAGMLATNGYTDRSTFVFGMKYFGDFPFSGIDNSEQIKAGLTQFTESVDTSEQSPYLLSRDGWKYLQPEELVAEEDGALFRSATAELELFDIEKHIRDNLPDLRRGED